MHDGEEFQSTIIPVPDAVPDEFGETIRELSDDEKRLVRDYVVLLRRYIMNETWDNGDQDDLSAYDIRRTKNLDQNPWTPVLKYVSCNKERCNSCPHGPYLYLVQRIGPGDSDLEWYYVGPGGMVTEELPEDDVEQVEKAVVVGASEDKQQVMSKTELPEHDRDKGHETPISFEGHTYLLSNISNEVIGYVDTEPFEYCYNGPQPERIRRVIRESGEIEISVADDDLSTVPISEEARADVVVSRLQSLDDIDIKVSETRSEELPRELLDFARIGRRDPWTVKGYPSLSDVGVDDAVRRWATDVYPYPDEGWPMEHRLEDEIVNELRGYDKEMLDEVLAFVSTLLSGSTTHS